MLSKVIVLAIVLLAVEANRVNFRPCPGGLHVPNWVESDMCPNDRCQLRRGTVFSARAQVTPQAGFSQLWVDMTATLLGIPFPITIPPGYENACPFLENASCPVQAGGTYVWHIQQPVNASYPAVSGLNMQIRAGEDGRWVACAQITADIV